MISSALRAARSCTPSCPSCSRRSRKVTAHVGRIHQVTSQFRQFWCETMDLLPESPRRAESLTPDTRVWAVWLDGRWYPGRVDDAEGPLRHVTWEDGDSMWLDPGSVV